MATQTRKSSNQKSTSGSALLKFSRDEQKAKFARLFDARSAAFEKRRARIADRFRQKLITRAFAAAGIDLNEIKARQREDRKTVAAFLAEERKRVIAASAAVAKRQKTWAKERHDRMLAAPPAPTPQAGPGPEPRPHLPSNAAATLETATDITVNGSAETDVKLSPLQNILKLEAIDQTEDTSLEQERGVIATWEFLWTAPITGNLGFFSGVQLNGLATLEADGDCIGTPYAKLSMAGQASVVTASPSGGSVTQSPIAFQYEWSKHAPTASSLKRSEIIPIVDDLPMIFNPGCPVVAGEPVILRVSLGFDMHVLSGIATVDFNSAGFQINVPEVLVFIN